MNRIQIVIFGVFVAITSLAAHGQEPLGTGFSYQGQLDFEGSPVIEPVDLIVNLFDVGTGGVALAVPVVLFAVPVDEGRFAVDLDFGMSYLDERRWIEIEVKLSSNDGLYTTIAPRQEIKPAPIALFALTGNVGPAGPQGPPGASLFDGYRVSLPVSQPGSSNWVTLASEIITLDAQGLVFGSFSGQAHQASYEIITFEPTGNFAMVGATHWQVLIDGVVILDHHYLSGEEWRVAEDIGSSLLSASGSFASIASAGVHTIHVRVRYVNIVPALGVVVPSFLYVDGGAFDLNAMSIFWDH